MTFKGKNYLQKLHQIPCSRCTFFTNDHRLKCTVNPYEAGTESAIGCRDFEPKAEPKSPCLNCSAQRFHKSPLFQSIPDNH